MITKFFVVGAIAAALVVGTANSSNTGWINPASLNQAYKSQWRFYKMIGLGVYNQNDEKVCDISELLAD